MKLCGDHGHKSKNGGPCNFKIADGASACHHHAADQTRAKEILSSAILARKQLRLPESIETGELKTLHDLKRGFAQVIRNAATEKHVDLRRLDVIIKCLNGANAVLQTEATKELSELLLKIDGHGASLLVLQRLKEAPLRHLPGKLRRQTPPNPEGPPA